MNEMDETLAGRLQAAGHALGMELDVVQIGGLLTYLSLLQRWNATYNLTAVRDPLGMLTQHLVDCLALLPPLRRHLETKGKASHRLLDVGSGGGLPGVVVALLQPALDITCVDAVGKKAAFVQQVAGQLQLANLHAVHVRVERLKARSFDVVTSRAFASLADFTRLTHEHLADDGVWLAMKGRVPHDEMAALPADIDVFHVEPLAVPDLDAQRCLVWMRPAVATSRQDRSARG